MNTTKPNEKSTPALAPATLLGIILIELFFPLCSKDALWNTQRFMFRVMECHAAYLIRVSALNLRYLLSVSLLKFRLCGGTATLY